MTILFLEALPSPYLKPHGNSQEVGKGEDGGDLPQTCPLSSIALHFGVFHRTLGKLNVVSNQEDIGVPGRQDTL